ncbi:ABC-three component system protein [Zhongshania borealis]|uniref:ABC-three component systems C-terminal domain-containing protein n=1 Tax=Zhongshania borealis TaxID=889488 RepID=A0ABP7X1K7_9GAMM
MTTDNNNSIKCIQKEISGNWLTNGHLEACILKLSPPAETEWQNDNNRTENVSIITQLLKPLEGSDQSLLAQEFPDKPALVLTPELAFGSPDFESLDTIVKQYNQNLILICGFGVTSGGTLNTLAEKPGVEGAWNASPNPHKKYNGGWVWIKDGNSTQCYIFLKNYLEQNTEITGENIVTGDYILRLDGNDVIVFPLVCADLISKEDNNPSSRIVKSLNKNSSTNKRVLVTGSLLNIKSESDHWKTAIGDLLESSKSSKVRLLLSNCINPSPVKDEEIDKWRCLSGVFQHREGCKPPPKPLPYVRYVNGEKFSGFVLRNSEIGAVFGKLQWTNNSSEGKQAFSECQQHIWNGSEFYPCDGICAADELYRFIVRNKGSMLHSKINSNEASRTLADSELDKLLTELSPTSNSLLRSVAGKLFQKCLKGIKQEVQFCPDQLYSRSENLDCAITTLSLIQHAIEAELMPEGKELGYGQLLSDNEEHEILIWDSSEHTANQLYSLVKEGIVKDGGSARPLMIVGRGNGGGSFPDEGRMHSNWLADISNAPPLNADVDKDICEANDRVVFWKNQGKVDDVLASAALREDLLKSLREEIIVPEDL